jgi:amino acid adenylation domain-containing protein
MTAPAPSYPAGWDPVLAGRFLLRTAGADADRVAIVSGSRSFTYRELGLAADAYAASLHAAGLRHGDAVAIQMEPGFESVATFLACSEAGFVYVPFNADAPAPRVEAVCAAVGARCMVRAASGPRGDDDAGGWQPAATALADGTRLRVTGSSRPPDRLDHRLLESDPAYVIFTSGSTGRPKGVVMTHRAAVVAFRAIADACRAPGRVASLSPLGFDFTLFNMAAALSLGRTLVFVPRALQLHPRRLVELLRDEAVEQVHSVPSTWSILLRHCPDDVASLRELSGVVLGAEEVTPALVRALRARLPSLRVLNAYGPTESICASFHEVPNPLPDEWSTIPIGDAHPGAELLLVDPDGESVREQGVPGDLYLRAASLFSGYWDSPEETAAALVPDPLRPASGERVFRTGDVAVRTPAGLVFAGRRDHQVQVHGHRVELEEVERCLVEAPGVAAAALAHLRSGDDQTLVALVVRDDEATTAGHLRAHCRRELPDYMVPGRVFFVDEMPRGPTGKLDRAEVAAVAAERMGAPAAPDRALEASAP